jgi:peptidoglycan/LPS O-acetylase OafA/YrhL
VDELVMKYFKQIDGLRALAVIAVIAHHWVPATFRYSFLIHYGAYGVDLFFVISGFLITRILIEEKTNGKGLIENIRTFYIRRTLRIFPIYYIYLLIIFLINWTAIKPYAISLLGYYFNLDMYFKGWPKIVYIQHLWSLSVEEQFYLIWPLILFFYNGKRSFQIILASIIISMLLSFSFLVFSPYKELKLFTPFSFISLSLGAVIAFLKDGNFKIPYKFYLATLLLFIFALLKSDFIPHFPGKNIMGFIVPFPSLIFFLLVYKVSDGYVGLGKFILENNYLVFIGKISYGLYLYHMIIPFFFFENTSWINATYNLGILLFISIFSWYLIEKPINKVKQRFSYN